MNKGEDDSKVVALGAPMRTTSRLPYIVELWNLPRTAPERVIGRAASAVLARAIFTAARSEHLGRRIVLRRGSQVIAETG
ncbi:hypothetical protein [Phenylobacterium sp.]|uniref:hypothetical protein n=1 Tax=Phenylobacterium sp. TaxID=1871053 RepID=UPI002DF63172|nr:hypothetical protein [Phenylobacterium sp.]